MFMKGAKWIIDRDQRNPHVYSFSAKKSKESDNVCQNISFKYSLNPDWTESDSCDALCSVTSQNLQGCAIDQSREAKIILQDITWPLFLQMDFIRSLLCLASISPIIFHLSYISSLPPDTLKHTFNLLIKFKLLVCYLNKFGRWILKNKEAKK